MKQTIIIFVLACVLSLVGCTNGSEGGSGSAAEADRVSESGSGSGDTTSLPSSATSPVAVAGTSLSIVEIAPITDSFPANVRKTFDRYTQVIAPNGKPINIYAQNKISDAQMIQARNTLIFWLTDVPNTTYGADKSAVANKMGENEALLMLLNGSDGESDYPDVNGQPLFETELVVPGSAAYINNDYEKHRDATFEEILHLVHDTGIGVDGDNTQPGALPAFQKEIRAATNNAIANNFQIWPTTAASERDTKQWFDELSNENSLTQEYLAAVIDSYYGLWAPYNEADAGMWGFYIAKTRTDIESKDPMGAALMSQFFSPYLTYNAQLDASFDGTFTMTFDPNTPYTHKSQYLLQATLTGSNNANLTGNDQDNKLGGNAGDNTLDGLAGVDTALYPRAQSEYTVTRNQDGTITVVGDGTDTLVHIEQIQFSDQVVKAD